jgi:D-arabinose 5-phosphate isomerase GutQ
MAATRLRHVGFDAHAVGEATAPSVREGDGFVVISGSGETAVILHLARLREVLAQAWWLSPPAATAPSPASRML